MVGGNIRYDAPLINARLRKRYLNGNFRAARIGGYISMNRMPTFAYEELGTSLDILDSINNGNHMFSEVLNNSKKPMIIVSQDAFSRPDGLEILTLSQKIATKFKMINEDWNGFNVLHNSTSNVGALDLNILNKDYKGDINAFSNEIINKKLKALFLLGADSIKLNKNNKDQFKIYIGHHGDYGASIADVVLPGAAY